MSDGRENLFSVVWLCLLSFCEVLQDVFCFLFLVEELSTKPSETENRYAQASDDMLRAMKQLEWLTDSPKNQYPFTEERNKSVSLCGNHPLITHEGG